MLVTHQLQYLADVDQIIVIKEGRIAEMGSYIDLMLANQYSYFTLSHKLKMAHFEYVLGSLHASLIPMSNLHMTPPSATRAPLPMMRNPLGPRFCKFLFETLP